MDNLILANHTNVFNLFGWGFLAGAVFVYLIAFTYDYIAALKKKAKQAEETEAATEKKISA